MQRINPKYILFVFVGGASYGVVAPVMKLGMAHGLTWQQCVASQAVFGLLLFAMALLALRACGRRPQRVTAGQVLRLMGVGMCTCCTNTLYAISLTMLPACVSLALLFQFVWIGSVLEAISTKKLPHPMQLAAAAIVVAGTVLASDVLVAGQGGSFPPLGVACALLSALSCAMFMFLSSKVETGMPFLQRGLFIACGASVLSLCICPTFVVSGVMLHEAAQYGIVLGLFALLVPVTLFGLGTPHIPTGLSTVLASAELPCGIILAFLLLGEPLGAMRVAGVVIILLGVVVAQLRPRCLARFDS